MDGLREQVMINQFVVVAGCAADQARQLLQAAHWQFETALSIFLQEASLPSVPPQQGSHFNLVTPCNTPATPPNFPDTLLAFSRMSTGTEKLDPPPASGAFSTSPSHQPPSQFPPTSNPQYTYAKNPYTHHSAPRPCQSNAGPVLPL